MMTQESSTPFTLFDQALALQKAGKVQKAFRIYKRLSKTHPGYAEAWCNLGSIYFDYQHYKQAKHCFYTAHLLKDKFKAAQINLIQSYERLYEYENAVKLLKEMLAVYEEDTQVLFLLGNFFQKFGKFKQAMRCYHRILQGKDKDLSLEDLEAQVHANLTVCYAYTEDKAQAISHCKQALKLKPEHPSFQIYEKILEGKQEGMESLYESPNFDLHAEEFDKHLDLLQYKAPENLAREFHSYLKGDAKECIDLGCGTGLSTLAFKKYISSADGCDPSKKMLAQAKKKGIYRSLFECTIDHLTQKISHSYELALCFDVFVYIANPWDSFKQVHSLLKEKGLFIFSIEVCKDSDYELLLSGHWAQSVDFCSQGLEKHGFHILKASPCILREEFSRPIEGYGFLAQKCFS